MAYHDDLLDQAFTLVHKEAGKPKQASVRRAVSTAYYALFHMLVAACVANWKRKGLRDILGRAFDQSSMKSASNRIQDKGQFPYEDQDPAVVSNLRYVAKTFAQLQEKRHVADYDNATFWTTTEALSQVASVQEAFRRWKSVAKEPIAQAYLISLLVKKRD